MRAASRLLSVVGMVVVSAALGVGCDPGGGAVQPDLGGAAEVDAAMSDPAPSAAPARDALRKTDWTKLTLRQALDRFDVNGDGVIDAKDAADLERCLAAGKDLDGLLCDLVADGRIDRQDAYLLSLVAGEQRARPDDRRMALAASLRADAAADASLAPGAFDWNADGKYDGADLIALATAIEGDRARFDLDGDGLVGLGDAAALADRQARAKWSAEPAPTTDVDGNGKSDRADVRLLADLAMHVTELTFGLLDVDQDGRVDERDFCLVSDSPKQQSYYPLLMPTAAAQTAFAGKNPRFALCRADGKPIVRNLARLDTPYVVKIEPQNLYLQPVDAIPAGYTPDKPALAAGRRLHVISTVASAHRITSVSFPWDVTAKNGNEVKIAFTGPALAAGASLLLPRAIVPLDGSGPMPHSRRAPMETDRAFELPDVYAGNDGPAAEELAKNVAEMQATYEALIAGCPCTLSQAERDELVRFLIRAKNCLESTRSVTEAQLYAAELEAARLARLHVSSMNEAAGQWELLSEDYVWMEVIKTLLLIAETGYDFLTGGLKKSFEGALANLLGEVTEDNAPKPESVTGMTAVSLEASLGGGVIAGALTDMVASRTGPASIGGFTKDFLQRMGMKLAEGKEKGETKAQIESVIKTMIKMLPVYYLQYRELVAQDAEHRATQYAEAHYEAMLKVANLRHALRAIDEALAIEEDLRKRFLDKLAMDGCPLTIATADPCSFDLEAAISAARGKLETALAAADKRLDAAMTATRREGSTSECATGMTRGRLDEATLDVASAGRELAQLARSGASAEAVAEAETRQRMESEERRAIETEYSKLCIILTETEITTGQLDEMKAAEADAQAAHDGYAAAVKAALAAYAACVAKGGPPADACSFDAALAGTSPWAQAARCLGCVPMPVMDCCGDGKIQLPEQCDPGSMATSCPGEAPCIKCKCGPAGVPQSVAELAAQFGVPPATLLAAWQPLALTEVVHGSVNVPKKFVAGDHTMLTGYYAGVITLDAMQIGRFACGPGQPGAFTVCPVGGMPLVPGPTVIIVTSLAMPMPMPDPNNVYQYGFVFDRDAVTGNNFTPPAPYLNHFFKGTDYWIEADRTAMGAWSVKGSIASGMNVSPAMTRAHVFVNGNAMAVAVPASELRTMHPDFRLTAFRHRGDEGQRVPYDWDGSLHPPVSLALQSFADARKLKPEYIAETMALGPTRIGALSVPGNGMVNLANYMGSYGYLLHLAPSQRIRACVGAGQPTSLNYYPRHSPGYMFVDGAPGCTDVTNVDPVNSNEVLLKTSGGGSPNNVTVTVTVP